MLGKKYLNKNALVTAGVLIASIPSLAQVDVTPFWRGVDSVSRSLGNSVNDLYTDLSLLDTIKLAGETFPITWKSSDTLFLAHDGRVNGRFVGENKEVTSRRLSTTA